MKSIVVYCLVDPETSEIRYVGASSRPLHTRINEHLCRAKTARKISAKKAWFLGLLTRGLRPTARVLEQASANNWEEREHYWIDRLSREGNDLVNVAGGGLGMRYSHDLASAINRGRKGIKHSAVRNAKISAAHTGRKRSEAHREAISKALKGRVPSEATQRAKVKTLAKTYLLTYRDGHSVQTTNLREFCRNNRVSHSSLYGVVRGKRHSLNGIVRVELISPP